MKISATTFFLCIAYVIYDWRRERGDRWDKRIKSKVRKLIHRVKRTD